MDNQALAYLYLIQECISATKYIHLKDRM